MGGATDRPSSESPSMPPGDDPRPFSPPAPPVVPLVPPPAAVPDGVTRGARAGEPGVRKAAPAAPRLGRRLRALRQQAGLSQSALALRLGISPSYLNLLEHDRRPLTTTLLL